MFHVEQGKKQWRKKKMGEIGSCANSPAGVELGTIQPWTVSSGECPCMHAPGLGQTASLDQGIGG